MRLKASLSKYDLEQGFQEHQYSTQPVIQFNSQTISNCLIPISKRRSISRLQKQKEQAKLRFISIQRHYNFSANYDYLKQEQKKLAHKSMNLNKEDHSFLTNKKSNKIIPPITKLPPLYNYNNPVSKIKRSQIGQNLLFIQYNSVQVKNLKQNLVNQGASLIFEDNRQNSSHGLFKKFLRLKNCNNFLRSKYNASLLQKITSSYINPKNEVVAKGNQMNLEKGLQFFNDFESSNLDFVTQINPFEYDIYIKADTNSMGHQNWFYFRLVNNSGQKKNLFLNVCNLKRSFKLVKKGQKIFYRQRKIDRISVKTSIQNQQEEWSEWLKIQEEVQVLSVYQNIFNDSNKKKRVFKLSFSATLLPEMEYEFSLLPPFTYSQMLRQIEKIQNSCKNAQVQTLTFSLLGLCIPVLTFTNKQSINQKKKVILISARIHPGQTCASYVARGIIDKLSQQSDENYNFLSKHIIKIIPMINPDGVVLGNFRTNYLGNDLNRSFNQENQVTFPQIVALKELGKKLKEQYKEKFFCFLDLHGHSSQKNIFLYGPNYDQNHKNFSDSRFFPQTLSYLAEQFDYDKCTFNLEQSKTNTARGYFLKSLKVMAFTIQSSYALFDSKKQPDQKNQYLKVSNWINFGCNLIKAIQIWTKSNLSKLAQGQSQQNQCGKQSSNLQKIEGQDYLVIGRIKKQLCKEMSNLKKKVTKRKNSLQGQQTASDSDGQDDSEDISSKQREKLEKKFIEANNNANMFPRILRPAIVHPEVNPPVSLFSKSKIIQNDNILIKGSIVSPRMKKNRYQNVKLITVNKAYTEYLKQVKGLEFLKPSVNLMKLQRKQSVLMRLSNLEAK